MDTEPQPVEPTNAAKDNDNGKVVEDKEDAYAYLDRANFTSEKFKIEIRNMPNYYGMPELKKLLNNKLKLDASKVKRPRSGSSFVYVCFRSDDARTAALEVLNGYKWKGKDLTARKAQAVPDPLVLKRSNNEEIDRGGKKLKPEDVVDKLKDQTTPLWRKPYAEQLEMKTKNICSILRKFAADLEHTNPCLAPWLKKQREKYEGLPCEMLPIRPSPITEGYRNKCEFAIGINDLTGQRTVGMRLGKYAEGSVCVVSPDELLHVPPILKKAVSLFEKYLQSSNLEVYSQETHTGHWRTLTARYGFRTKELMLIFQLLPQHLSETEIAEVELQLRDLFSSEEAKELGKLSLFMQYGNQRDRVEPKCILGDPYIHEEMCGYKFRISPSAFFQINTEATEVLYQSIAELSSLCDKTSLIDVCCGAGTIGISLSKQCGEILGLEISAEAVKDAKKNAEVNNVSNAQFFTGKAEDLLAAVIHRATKERIVAVVDPPRAGLERNAISHLRRTKKLEQFVFASCDPRQAMKNFIDFGRMPSKQYPNDPFVPVLCVPVDMFPHTDSCELVIFFKRFVPEVEEGTS